MRNLRALTVIVLTGLTAMAAPADGRTWRVEKDGSGDFTVIQHAVNAASSGDVIEIGPGRYTDVTLFSWGKVTVWLDGTKSLTFVGAGRIRPSSVRRCSRTILLTTTTVSGVPMAT